MNYLEAWEIGHRKTILEELDSQGIKFTTENISLVIEKTSFKIRSKKYPDKCPYYTEGIACHQEVKDLNCFLCACPNYKSTELAGGCRIGSKKGKYYFNKNLPEGKVWDCSDCSINHSPNEVKKYLTEMLTKKD